MTKSSFNKVLEVGKGRVKLLDGNVVLVKDSKRFFSGWKGRFSFGGKGF